MTTTYSLAKTGTQESEIPVRISYRIINLFSEGLYSSPNKAIEELVANSYDAMAQNVHVIVPTNVEASDALIWVIDDGTSMDSDGFSELWRIATSSKRAPGHESSERRPIGKFGIGKLATYVLARQLTYVCKCDGQYRAVTMDYTIIDEAQDYEQRITLPVRVLTEDEAASLLSPVSCRKDKAAKAMPLFGQGAPPSWTVAAMGHLTPLAQRLTPGRLKWVLCTALPLSPQFRLFFNGEPLQSAKDKQEPLETWMIGKDDKVAGKLGLETGEAEDGTPIVSIEGLGPIHGTSRVYADTLTGGKAETWGRSHGFFVMVRGRLVNIDDALFGLPQLSHGPFARFRMVVHADGLDDVLRAAREGVLVDSQGVKNFQNYIEAKFNEARNYYTNWLHEKEREESLSTRIAATPQSLSRRPLLTAIRRLFDGSIPELMLTRVPENMERAAKEELLRQLEADFDSDDGLIKQVRFEPLRIESPLAVFDVEQRCICVNLLHPFYMNYSEHYNNNEPFELIAVAEVLTEAYLYEADVAPEAARRVMKRRDDFLRELVFGRPLSAPLAAEYLRDSVADAKHLEGAVYEALKNLGFEVTRLGGNGKPDGIALARLGIRNATAGGRSDYNLTYDAKSTGNARVKAHTVGISTIARHRDDYEAQYALVVAPDFEGSENEDSAILKEAKTHGVTLMTTENLARLVLAAATRRLGFVRLRDLFETCRGPRDAGEWVDSVMKEDEPASLLPTILEAIWEMTKVNPEPVTFSAITERLRLRDSELRSITTDEVKAWMQSMARLAGQDIDIQGDVVYLNVSPERILREIRAVSARLPELLQRQSMISALVTASETREMQEANDA